METIMNKLPVLTTKLSMVFAGMFLLFGGVVSAAIITELAQTLSIGGSVDAPFLTQITAVSSGTLIDEHTVTGANTVAGSDYETVDVNITNNANQDIDAWLEYSCSSADDSLTSDYIDVQFDGVDADRKCDDLNIVYVYRDSVIETFVASTTELPQISYKFPTDGGYFEGDFLCQVNIATAKAC